MIHSARLRYLLHHPLGFAWKVLRGFRANQGFLLAGAVAYYTLLSIVPMFALILVGLSQLVNPANIIETLRGYLLLVAPGPDRPMPCWGRSRSFCRTGRWSGWPACWCCCFSAFHRVAVQRRHFLVSAILPYLYISLMAVGLLVVTAVSGSLHALAGKTVTLFGHVWALGGLETLLIYLMGVLGEVLLLTSLYLAMPVGRLAFRQALVGGITATLLWEITRHVMVWYFSTLSFVNVIYGAFTTVVVILLSLEAAAIILLLGAQAIAEYERLPEADRVGR